MLSINDEQPLRRFETATATIVGERPSIGIYLSERKAGQTGTVFGQGRCPMTSETRKVHDFSGGAERDRTTDLLNAICTRMPFVRAARNAV
jgi:hypothetical protein